MSECVRQTGGQSLRSDAVLTRSLQRTASGFDVDVRPLVVSDGNCEGRSVTSTAWAGAHCALVERVRAAVTRGGADAGPTRWGQDSRGVTSGCGQLSNRSLVSRVLIGTEAEPESSGKRLTGDSVVVPVEAVRVARRALEDVLGLVLRVEVAAVVFPVGRGRRDVLAVTTGGRVRDRRRGRRAGPLEPPQADVVRLRSCLGRLNSACSENELSYNRA